MNGKLYVYALPYEDALKNGEEETYWESYHRNIECAEAIRKAIDENYDGRRLNADCVRTVVDRFGYDRTCFVTANTLCQLMHDRRISRDNKAWAAQWDLLPDGDSWNDKRFDYVVTADKGLLDIFARLVRKQQETGIFTKEECDNLNTGSLEGRLLVLKPNAVRGETPIGYQLFYCTEETGDGIQGVFPLDKSEWIFPRTSFLGELRQECMSAWIMEWLEEFGQQEQQQENGMQMEI